MSAPAPHLLPSATLGFPHAVFVHGNGDGEALWTTTLWRFESNGWPRDRLHTIDLPYPTARDDDGIAQPGRSSSEDHWRFLAAAVAAVQAAHGDRPVVLIANSRGGFAVRNFMAQGGAALVSHAVLGGTPNHGVWAHPAHRPGNEFNGHGPLLTRLNTPGPDGHEVPPGAHWLTLRSDGNDKYAQPTGEWVGLPGVPTSVDADGPALAGATNVLMPGADHREVSFSAAAFEHTWRFLTGRDPGPLVPEARPVLSGKVSGFGVDNRGGFEPSNLPLAGARLTVYGTDAATGQRTGPALHRQAIGADGRWGPLTVPAAQPCEFVIEADGYAITHVYRSGFARSSAIVHLRAEQLPRRREPPLAIVVLSRPRGYFDRARDRLTFDGASPPPDIPPGVAGVSTSEVRVTDQAGRPVFADFNGERIAGLAWPLAEGHAVTFELND